MIFVSENEKKIVVGYIKIIYWHKLPNWVVKLNRLIVIVACSIFKSHMSLSWIYLQLFSFSIICNSISYTLLNLH